MKSSDFLAKPGTGLSEEPDTDLTLDLLLDNGHQIRVVASADCTVVDE